MNYLSVENISKSFGDSLLFENLSFGINKNQKIGFIAKNGTGKTTLLKIIADEEITIRQAIGEDYELTENPRFIVVTESPIPDKLISKIKQVNGIKGITIY